MARKTEFTGTEAAHGPASAIDRLMALVAEDLAHVNALILERMQSPVPLIPELAGHIIRAGGKRLRPMLTLATAALLGYRGDGHIKLAATVEFIHTATLLHDDVVDGSALRRGLPTANAVWGNQASVLVGDFLFARSFELMVETGSLPVIGALAQASSIIVEGEVMQLASTNDIGTTEDTYLKVIASKTAALFAAAARVPAILAGRPQAEADALATFGEELGIAFQLVDDALDYGGRTAALGKHTGDDLRDGKVTLPVILAYRRGDQAERSFWRQAIGTRSAGEETLAQALGYLQARDALADTERRAVDYAMRAKAALAPFADGPTKQALLDLADYCVMRVS